MQRRPASHHCCHGCRQPRSQQRNLASGRRVKNSTGADRATEAVQQQGAATRPTYIRLSSTRFGLLTCPATFINPSADSYGSDGPRYVRNRERNVQLASDTVTVRTNAAPYVQRWHTALPEGPSLRCPDPEALQVRRPAHL